MPELPDILLYQHALASRVAGRRVESVRVVSPFVLRTFDPPIDAVDGRTVAGVERVGKRIVFDLGDELFVVVHLMIAGRFRWSDKAGEKGPGKIGLASFLFDRGTLHLVESSQQKRAGIWVIRGRDALRAEDRGGIDVLAATVEQFASQLRRENHTLKRSLTDPRLFDGIGNAYSDEILHAAKLSPVKLTAKLTDDEIARLHAATQSTLTRWIATLRDEFAAKFPGPGDVTAFRPDFAVHGKFGQPCPVCQTAVQRIRYADNETNYCPRCQTDGKLLADRSLSMLLKKDWPRTVDELESRAANAQSPGGSPASPG
jgi:formamidopyrimidine-DNA glycosylase